MIDFVFRRWPAAIAVGLTACVAVIGIAFHGLEFVTRPLPVPEWVSRYWYTSNFILSTTAWLSIYRVLARHRAYFTPEVMALGRGTVLLMFGGSLGYLARMFHEPTISMGSPLITIGALMIIWAMNGWRPPADGSTS